MKISLIRLTLTAWLAWLLSLIVMAWLSYSRVFHPSFLYIAIPLAVLAICSLAVFGGGIWRVIRGPTRLKAFAILLFGIMPLLWMAAYIQYLYDFASGRNHRPNWLLKPAYSVTSFLAEPYVRIRYPYQYEGERFVMWSDSPKPDEKQMAAMDEHIRDIEKALGQKTDYKVYWIRGPVWGVGGRYGFGWSLGNDSKTSAEQGIILNYIDRHEVAHFILDQLLPNSSNQPMVLIEGWAQHYSGNIPEDPRKTCWLAQKNGNLLSLRELTKPHRYHFSDEPMYYQGAVLVDYILRQFGHEKFLELCKTCSEATFSDDVQRVLGISMDELDIAYQADIAKQDSPDKQYLLSLKLGDCVDKEQWQNFVDDYYVGANRLRKPFRHSSVTLFRTMERTDEQGHKETDKDRFELYRDTKKQARLWYMSDRANGMINTSDFTLNVYKDDIQKPWRMSSFFIQDCAANLSNNTLYPENDSSDSEIYSFLCIPLAPLNWQKNNSKITITGFRTNESNSKLKEVSFNANFDEVGKNIMQRGIWYLDPDRDYSLVEAKIEEIDTQGAKSTSRHITIDYNTIDGNFVPILMVNDSTGIKGKTLWTDEIASCSFGPPSAKVFDPATYGDFHPTQIANDPPSHIGTLTWIAATCTILGLLSAFSLLPISPKRIAKQVN